VGGDPLQKFQVGQPFKPKAETFNTFVDAARAHRQRQHDRGRQPHGEFRQTGIIRVRNDSGADRDRFDILGINTPVITPADNLQHFQNHVVQSVVTPTTSSHQGQFVVLLEPIASGQIGRAYVSGVCPARLYLQSSAVTDVRAAEVRNGNTDSLEPSTWGSAAVLWHDPYPTGATGPQNVWAVVRLGNQVSLSQQQAFSALHAYNSEDQTLSSSGDETLKIDTKHIDQGGIWSLSTSGSTEGELTVNATGLFRVNLTIDVGFYSTGPGSTDTSLGGKAWIEKSPSVYTWGRVLSSLVKANVWYYATGGGYGWHGTGSRTILINATQGDKYRVRIEQGGEGHTVAFYAPIISVPPGYPGMEIGCSWVWTPV